MKKIYISGKITGLDYNEAFSNFERIEKRLHELFECEVINPMKAVPFEEGKTWRQYMADDIKLLVDCDTIVMMSNAHESKGALIEYGLASQLGIEIIYENIEMKLHYETLGALCITECPHKDQRVGSINCQECDNNVMITDEWVECVIQHKNRIEN